MAPELREILVDEMVPIRSDLDDEVSNLTELTTMAPVMANVMRHLHTIKGSSLLAEANQLGDLTHHTESYLESRFIRNVDDLRSVRQTLEQYIDELDNATQAYQGQQPFVLSADLLTRLGVEDFMASVEHQIVDASEQSVAQTEDVEDDIDLAPQLDALGTSSNKNGSIAREMKISTWLE